uniref:hypothetical protein n=1 Tax=Alloprevotella sp. TaxID=1872471 RepID=UPI004029E615
MVQSESCHTEALVVPIFLSNGGCHYCNGEAIFSTCLSNAQSKKTEHPARQPFALATYSSRNENHEAQPQLVMFHSQEALQQANAHLPVLPLALNGILVSPSAQRGA